MITKASIKVRKMSVTMTSAAAERVKSFMVNRGKGLGLRLGIKTTGCSGLAYVLERIDIFEFAARSKHA